MPDTSAAISVPEGASKGKSLHDALSAAGYDKRLAALYDVIRFGPEFLSTQEFLALLFHVERSIPYNKTSDSASLGQMHRGVWSKKGKRWIRGGSGMSKSTAAQANASLEGKGLLSRTPHKSAERGHEANEYEVQWSAIAMFFEKQRAEKVFTPYTGKRYSPYTDSRYSPYTGNQTRNSNASSSVGNEKQGLSGFSGKVGSVGEPEQPKKTTPKGSFSFRSDDDEKPSTLEAPRTVEAEKPLSQRVKPETQNPEETPEERFTRELIERHGTTVDVEEIIGLVKHELAWDSITDDLVEYAAKKTTGKPRNLPGYYRSLVKKFVKERDTAAMARLLRMPSAPAEPVGSLAGSFTPERKAAFATAFTAW